MSGDYQEWRVSGRLADRVECVWQRTHAIEAVGAGSVGDAAGQDADGAGDTVLIVPDGCLDLVWMDDELVLVGADRSPRSTEATAGRSTAGIRFRPGAAGSAMDLPASEVVDQQVPAELIWPAAAPPLIDDLVNAPQADLLGLLQRFVADLPGASDPLVTQAARLLGDGDERVSVVADRLGVSERQLHRRTTSAVGYGPKLLARVMRLQRLSTLSEPSLADLAYQAGYASQAHMSDDVRALTGMSPVRFLEYWRPAPALA
ncbi:MAG: helix-turn-helix domain-containing protein [Propionibacteriaceae bacterium]